MKIPANLTLDELAAIMNGQIFAIDLLTRLLEQRGLVDRKQYAAALRRLADQGQSEHTTEHPARRFDLMQFRQLAKMLEEDQRSSEQMPRWTPELILGGLSGLPDETTTS